MAGTWLAPGWLAPVAVGLYGEDMERDFNWERMTGIPERIHLDAEQHSIYSIWRQASRMAVWAGQIAPDMLGYQADLRNSRI